MEHVFGASGKRGCERRPAPKGSPRIGCTLPAITEYQNRPKTERKSQKTERKLFRALCGPTVNFQRLNTACSVTYINGSRSASIELLWTTPRSSVSMRCGRRAPLGLWFSPGSLRFVPHAHGSEVRSLPLITSHVLLRSRFAHALRSLVSQRKRRAAAHNRVVSGSENSHFRGTVNQALGDAVAGGVLGRLLATALCAVPLLTPVSALIWAHERP